MTAQRIVFIGDIGGNPNVLLDCLERAGVSDGMVPDGTVIIQVGDLVRCHKVFREGNDHAVRIAGDTLRRNPESYVQLIGNHEAAALGSPARENWDVLGSMTDRARRQLDELWTNGAMRLAVTVTTKEFGAVLATHAGLTRARWAAMGSPKVAEDAATTIRMDERAPMQNWSRAGLLVDDFDSEADVTWADVNLEFYEPWLTHADMPFTQIHGHASPFNWQSGDWWADATPAVRSATDVNFQAHRTITSLGPQRVAVSVDWNLGDAPLNSAPDRPLLELTVA